ncbi:acyl-CoA dehydrogenase family protein [Desertimonas flava]|uniref:acyl-CoA dehydrogenase family protein n=1 Tax=Desertimonas flava TaxID=2064846 RepID=UPI000E348609|nr:acyl-CoA dehydrogenase family protein [Desertimonas flava]
MDFDLSVEQTQLRDTVRHLMSREATDDRLRELDEQEAYPYELYARWVEMGLIGLPFPEEFGGMAGSIMDFVVVAEEIGRRGYDLAGLYGTPIFNGLNILEHGTDAQRAELIPALIGGRVRFSISITEPGAGSDAAALRAAATRVDGGYVLNGEKIFTSGADLDDTIICVYARTSRASRPQSGITCFLVDNTAPGLEIRRVRTVGRHMFPTTQVLLDDVFVADERVLGPVGGGWTILLSGLRLERLVTSAAYVGNARTVVDEALTYAKQREQFGAPIGNAQVIAHMLADMATDVEAAALMTYRAAWMLERGNDALMEICMAKLFGSERFQHVSNCGMQILGGYGYTLEVSMQRHWRAARGATITAGTSQMQRQTIARQLGLRPR